MLCRNFNIILAFFISHFKYKAIQIIMSAARGGVERKTILKTYFLVYIKLRPFTHAEW